VAQVEIIITLEEVEVLVALEPALDQVVVEVRLKVQ
jgi:hypothetical protein